MTLSLPMQEAFRDELLKIALVGKPLSGSVLGGAVKDLGKTMANWARVGWRSLGQGGARGGWMGKQDTWRAKLPIGEKSLFTGLTALAVPSAITANDPTGRNTSRAERSTSLAAGTLGTLAGTGALMSTKRFAGRPGWASLLGGTLGALTAERAATAPFRAVRRRTQYEDRERHLTATGYYK